MLTGWEAALWSFPFRWALTLPGSGAARSPRLSAPQPWWRTGGRPGSGTRLAATRLLSRLPCDSCIGRRRGPRREGWRSHSGAAGGGGEAFGAGSSLTFVFSPRFSPVFSYIRYSQICAQVVRAAMKPQYKAEAERAAMATVKTLKPKKE